MEERRVKNRIAITATTNLEYHLVGYRSSDEISMLVWVVSANIRRSQNALVAIKT
jgi:hypothetical protein